MLWSTIGSSWTGGGLVWAASSYAQSGFNGGFASGNGVMLGLNWRGVFALSRDGLSWSNYLSGLDYCYGIVYARGNFVAVGGKFAGLGRRISTSTNGLNWQTHYYEPSLPRMHGVTYGKHRFVAVGSDGAILVSATMLQLTGLGLVQDGFHLTLNGDVGAIYRLQTATDRALPDWRDVLVVTNTGGVTDLVDTTASQSGKRFYRAVAE